MDPKTFRSPESGRTIRTQTGYWAFLPMPLPPEVSWSVEMVTALSDAERGLSQLSTLAGNFPFPRLLTQPFMRQEAVLSPPIDGTPPSLNSIYKYHSPHLH